MVSLTFYSAFIIAEQDVATVVVGSLKTYQISVSKIRDGWLVGGFLWHINFCRLFNAKSIFMQIVSSISKQFSLARVPSLIVKTVLIQQIQFSINTYFIHTQLNLEIVLY